MRALPLASRSGPKFAGTTRTPIRGLSGIGFTALPYVYIGPATPI